MPTRVIWIVVYNDVVAVPHPIARVVVIVRRDVPVKAAEPETVPVSAFEAINVVAANFAAEVSVFPNVILMVASIVAAPFMTDPLIAVSMNVRSFGMALLVAIRLATLVATWAAATTRTTADVVAALSLSCAATCTVAASVATLYLSSAVGRRRAVGGNMAAANLRAAMGTAAPATPLPTASATVLPATSTSLLGKRRKRQN